MSVPKWPPGTKRAVLIACGIAVGLIIWQFSAVLAPLIVAVIIAYLLNPILNWITAHSPLKRGLAAAIVYVTFLICLALIPTIGGPIIVQQVRQLNVGVQTIYEQLNEALDYEITIGEVNISMERITEPFIGSLDQLFSPVASWAANLAVDIAGGFIWTIFILVVGFYLLLDANKFNEWVDSWIPPAYTDEINQLRQEIDSVWKAYFVGQVTLALIVGTTIGVVTAILGVRSALLLGLIAGLFELVPNWGFGISSIIGVAFAYLQGSSYLPIPNWAFATIIGIFYFFMWQVDTNYLIPRVIGNRLRLSPAVVIVGIIAGASVGGGLGLLLAAPTIASTRVLGTYLYRRLLDLEPYVIVTRPPPRPKQAGGQPATQVSKQVSTISQPKPEG